MKRIFTTSLYLLLPFLSASGIAGNLDLEPCINGEISSTGMFATQALEDKAIALAQAHLIPGSHILSNENLYQRLKDYSEFARLAKGD